MRTFALALLSASVMAGPGNPDLHKIGKACVTSSLKKMKLTLKACATTVKGCDRRLAKAGFHCMMNNADVKAQYKKIPKADRKKQIRDLQKGYIKELKKVFMKERGNAGKNSKPKKPSKPSFNYEKVGTACVQKHLKTMGATFTQCATTMPGCDKAIREAGYHCLKKNAKAAGLFKGMSKAVKNKAFKKMKKGYNHKFNEALKKERDAADKKRKLARAQREAKRCKAFPNVCKVRKAMMAARKVALAKYRKTMDALRKAHKGNMKDHRKALAADRKKEMAKRNAKNDAKCAKDERCAKGRKRLEQHLANYATHFFMRQCRRDPKCRAKQREERRKQWKKAGKGRRALWRKRREAERKAREDFREARHKIHDKFRKQRREA